MVNERAECLLSGMNKNSCIQKTSERETVDDEGEVDEVF